MCGCPLLLFLSPGWPPRCRREFPQQVTWKCRPRRSAAQRGSQVRAAGLRSPRGMRRPSFGRSEISHRDFCLQLCHGFAEFLQLRALRGPPCSRRGTTEDPSDGTGPRRSFVTRISFAHHTGMVSQTPLFLITAPGETGQVGAHVRHRSVERKLQEQRRQQGAEGDKRSRPAAGDGLLSRGFIPVASVERANKVRVPAAAQGHQATGHGGPCGAACVPFRTEMLAPSTDVAAGLTAGSLSGTARPRGTSSPNTASHLEAHTSASLSESGTALKGLSSGAPTGPAEPLPHSSSSPQ